MKKLRHRLKLSLRKMASDMGVSASFLSAIECNKKKMPKSLLEKIIKTYDLNKEQANLFRITNTDSVLIDVSDCSLQKKKLATLFSQKINNINAIQISEINDILNKHCIEK